MQSSSPAHGVPIFSAGATHCPPWQKASAVFPPSSSFWHFVVVRTCVSRRNASALPISSWHLRSSGARPGPTVPYLSVTTDVIAACATHAMQLPTEIQSLARPQMPSPAPSDESQSDDAVHGL